MLFQHLKSSNVETNFSSFSEYTVFFPLYDNPWSFTFTYPLKAVGTHIVGPFFLACKVASYAGKLLYDFCILLPTSCVTKEYHVFYSKTKHDFLVFGGFFIKMIPIIGPYLGFFYDVSVNRLNRQESRFSQASSVQVSDQETEYQSEIGLEDRLANIHECINSNKKFDAIRSIEDLRKESIEYELDDKSISIISCQLIQTIKKNIQFYRSHPLLVGPAPKKDRTRLSDKIKKIEKMEVLFLLNHVCKFLVNSELDLIKQGLNYLYDQFGDSELLIPLGTEIAKLKHMEKLNLNTILKIYEMQMELEDKLLFYTAAEVE